MMKQEKKHEEGVGEMEVLQMPRLPLFFMSPMLLDGKGEGKEWEME